jgi:hypothetical protein
MNLSQLPEQINKVEIQLLEARLRYESLQEVLMHYEAEIKAQVANDKTLKNETQRKARETELKSDQRSDYYQMKNRVKNDRVLVLQLEIELKLWRDRFSVSKLEKREEIAKLEGNSLSIVA